MEATPRKIPAERLFISHLTNYSSKIKRDRWRTASEASTKDLYIAVPVLTYQQRLAYISPMRTQAVVKKTNQDDKDGWQESVREIRSASLI